MKSYTFRFLTKQLLLMINMVNQYWSKVTTKEWRRLFDLLNEKKIVLQECIETDDKPKRKTNANEALDNLLSLLSTRFDQDLNAAA